MQSNYANDQADGLRRLLMRNTARVVAVVGARAGMGATSIVVNLAAALRATGKDVLVLDEHLSPANVANTLALRARYDLLSVAHGDRYWQDVALTTAEGVRVLPLARAMQMLPELGESQRVLLQEALTAASRQADVVLVDAVRSDYSICSSLPSEEPLLLVLNATASGITEAYSLIKQLSLHNGRQVFDIVVNKAGSEHEALAAFDNMALVAQRHLRVRLSYLGHIPLDEKMKRATQLCQTAVDAFPHSPAACALREIAQGVMHTPQGAGSGEDVLSTVVHRLIRQTRPAHSMAVTL